MSNAPNASPFNRNRQFTTIGVLADWIGIQAVTVLIALACATLTLFLLSPRGGLAAVRVTK